MEEGTAEGGILFRSLTSVTSVEQGGKDGVCFSSRAVPCPERLSIIVGAKQRFSALQPINRRRHGASFTCLTVSSYGYSGRRRIAAGLQRLKGNHLQNHGRGRFYYRRLQAPSKVGHSDNLPTRPVSPSESFLQVHPNRVAAGLFAAMTVASPLAVRTLLGLETGPHRSYKHHSRLVQRQHRESNRAHSDVHGFAACGVPGPRRPNGCSATKTDDGNYLPHFDWGNHSWF